MVYHIFGLEFGFRQTEKRACGEAMKEVEPWWWADGGKAMLVKKEDGKESRIEVDHVGVWGWGCIIKENGCGEDVRRWRSMSLRGERMRWS